MNVINNMDVLVVNRADHETFELHGWVRINTTNELPRVVGEGDFQELTPEQIEEVRRNLRTNESITWVHIRDRAIVGNHSDDGRYRWPPE